MFGNIQLKSAQTNNVFCQTLNADQLKVDVISIEVADNKSTTPFGFVFPQFNFGAITATRNAALSGIPTPLTGDFTLLAEQIIDGVIVVDTTSADVNITLDTSANILSAMNPSSSIGGNTVMFITDVGAAANTLTILPGVDADLQISGSPGGLYMVHSLGSTIRVVHLE